VAPAEEAVGRPILENATKTARPGVEAREVRLDPAGEVPRKSSTWAMRAGGGPPPIRARQGCAANAAVRERGDGAGEQAGAQDRRGPGRRAARVSAAFAQRQLQHPP
jgi:hypothetical protein